MAILIVTELLFLDPKKTPVPKAIENAPDANAIANVPDPNAIANAPDPNAIENIIAYDSDATLTHDALRTDDEIKSTIAGKAVLALQRAYPHLSLQDAETNAANLVKMAVETMDLAPDTKSLALYRTSVAFYIRKNLIGGSVQYFLWQMIVKNSMKAKKPERQASSKSIFDVTNLLP